MGGNVVSEIPAGLLNLSFLNDFGVVMQLLSAITITLMGFLGRFRSQKPWRPDPSAARRNQGLIVVLPMSLEAFFKTINRRSFSRSAVNFDAGAVTGFPPSSPASS
jgi:hypothetical protein